MTRAWRRPYSSTKPISVGRHFDGFWSRIRETSSATCHGARVEPRSATGTRCSLSSVTSTALRVDGTDAASRSRASEALAGASRPVDISPEMSRSRWISSMASRAAGSEVASSCSATSRWFQTPSPPRIIAAASQANTPKVTPVLSSSVSATSR